MKQNLNEEINRIKTLLYINESNVILEANPLLNIISKLTPALEGKLITGLETKLAKKLANATDAEITTALKSAEMAVIRKEVAEAIYLAEKGTIDSILSKYNMSVAGEAAAAYTELSAKGYNRAILKDINKAYKAGKTSGGAGAGGANAGSGSNPLTQPAPGPRPSGNLNLNPDATIRQAMDASIAETAKRDPKALAYYGTIETFGLSENVERAMKYQYSTIGSMTPSELLLEANKLSRQLDQKKYGWLIRLGGKVAEDPTKTVKVAGKTFLQGLLYYGAISLAISGLALTFAFRDKIMNLFGMGSGNQQNSNTGNMGNVDWNKYKPTN